MPDPGSPAPDGTASEALGLLEEALLGRVEQLLSERIDGLAGSRAPEPVDDRWLRVSEVAERVGACERTVYRALGSAALAGERLGAQWRIRPAAVEACSRAQATGPTRSDRPARVPHRRRALGRTTRRSEPAPERSEARALQRISPRATGGPAPVGRSQHEQPSRPRRLVA